jgi:recombination associated protein RdgC
MWFNNLRIYTLTEAIQGDVAAKLAQFPFVPCASLDPVKYGFVPTVPNGTDYIHVVNGCTLICAKRQEKILPGSVIKEILDAKVAELGRPVGRKERSTLKDEIIFSLLPKAMARSTLTYAYIDTTNGRIIVNAPNAKRAEDLLSKLREALGSLKCAPYSMGSNPMTAWVRESQAPRQFEFGEEIELKSPKDGRVVRCKRQDLTASEVLNHIESGMHVSKLALIWREHISFVVDDMLGIKSVKFSDVVVDKAAGDTFDQDFAVMTIELRAMLNKLFEGFSQ